jgi:6-phosphogluconolactonase
VENCIGHPRSLPLVTAALVLAACSSAPDTAAPAETGVADAPWPAAPDAGDERDAPAAVDAQMPAAAGADASEWGSRDAGEIDVARDSAPGPALPQYALVATYLGGISAFAVNPASGALAPVTGSPFDDHAGLYGVVAHPSGGFVYVTDYRNQRVDGFRVDPDSGALAALAGARVPLTAGKPLAITVDPQGRFLYVTTNDDNAILGFAVHPQTGALSALAPLALSSSRPGGNLAVDPSGRFLYAAFSSEGIRAFAIQSTSGALAELADSPFARTAVFGGAIAIHPDGGFLYASGPALNGFRIAADTGALTPLSGSPFATGVGSDPTATTLAIEPRGRYLYVSSTFMPGPLQDTVSAFSIDGATGHLTAVAGSPFPAAPSPYSVAVDREGRFVYVGNDDSNLVSVFSIDQSVGSLAPVAGSPFAAPGLQPEIVTFRPGPR